MKKIIIALLPLLFLLVNGCNSNDTATGTNPFGGGGCGGTGNVTIQIAIGQDDQGANVFAFNPSVAVKLTSALVVQAQLGINETVNNPNPDQVFNAGEYIGFYSANQAQVGQQWSFTFSGTLAQGGQAFTVPVNYTVQ